MKKFTPIQDPPPVRKFTAAIWREPRYPGLIAMVDIDYGNAAAFVSRYNARFDVKVTPTHLVGRAAALLFKEYPDANVKLGWNRFYQRNTVDIAYVIAKDNGHELAGGKLENADGQSLADTERWLRAKAEAIRAGRDPQQVRLVRRLRTLPIVLNRLVIATFSFLGRRLGVDVSRFGGRNDPAGSGGVTAVGTYGIETGFAPLMPYSDAAITFAVMAVRDRPWIVDGTVVPRPVLRVCCTADHRIIDAYLGGKYLAGLKRYLGTPELLLTDAERDDWEAGPA